MGVCKRAQATVSCEPAAVAWARHWALRELTDMYTAVETVAPDVQTVVSELVTNAVRADARCVSLALDAHHTYVRVATSDEPLCNGPTIMGWRGWSDLASPNPRL